MSNEKKPIVLVATGIMNAGGTESLIMETLRQSTGKVDYVLLIHYDREKIKGIFDDEISNLGYKIEYIPSVGSTGIFKYFSNFRNIASKIGKIDILHSHLNGVGGIICLAAKLAGIRHRICHCHADIHFTGSTMQRLKLEVQLALMKLSIEAFATDRWACSVAAWQRLFMPWHKRVVINNMIDVSRYMSTSERRVSAKSRFGLAGKKVVGAVGRVAPIKNYELILRAIAPTDVHFVCFGRFDPSSPYCASLLALGEKLGINDRIHWLGNSNSVCEDIHCIDLFVMPSFTEGFGMAAIEAQAAGIPCMLSNGLPKEIDVGAGLVKFLSPYKPEEWTDEMRAISSGLPNIPYSDLIDKFRTKGYDSPSYVIEIESKYLKISCLH